MDKNRIAYCGVNCSTCSDLAENKCPGCRQTNWSHDDICLPVSCCRERGISLCGECASFPCRDMQAFYEESDSHIIAYQRMLAINRNKH